MKKRISDTLFCVSMILSFVCIIIAFINIVKNNPDWLKNLGIYSLTLVTISMVMLLIMYIQKSRFKKREKIYVSYTEKYKEKAEKVMEQFPQKSFVVGSGQIPAGSNMEKMIPPRIIGCSKCYVIIGESIDIAQKYEIREMVKKKKFVIPVLLHDDVDVPQNLRKYKPVAYDEFVKERVVHD